MKRILLSTAFLIASLSLAEPLYADETNGRTHCAEENGTCLFSGLKTVMYGANGSYIAKIAKGGIRCDNATFGDPVFGVVKSCEYADVEWKPCAVEGETCEAPRFGVVRYGSGTSFNYQKTTSNSITCDNSTFGDPLVGTFKACDVATVGSNQTTIHCASEGETCNFPGLKLVSYGANGSFYSKIAKESIGCDNLTFGDPLFGVPKSCTYTDVQWKSCAMENGICVVPAGSIVRYGEHKSYYYQKTTSDSIGCDNATFGDPLFGTVKACDVAIEPATEPAIDHPIDPVPVTTSIDINAGPIWNNDDAINKCPVVCANANRTWNGQWVTTVWNVMSVCGCASNN